MYLYCSKNKLEYRPYTLAAYTYNFTIWSQERRGGGRPVLVLKRFSSKCARRFQSKFIVYYYYNYWHCYWKIIKIIYYIHNIYINEYTIYIYKISTDWFGNWINQVLWWSAWQFIWLLLSLWFPLWLLSIQNYRYLLLLFQRWNFAWILIDLLR